MTLGKFSIKNLEKGIIIFFWDKLSEIIAYKRGSTLVNSDLPEIKF